MSSYWDQNKGKLAHGAGSALKATGRAVSGIAKGGYRSYKASKEQPKGQDNTSRDFAAAPMRPMTDPHNFPAPPKHHDLGYSGGASPASQTGQAANYYQSQPPAPQTSQPTQAPQAPPSYQAATYQQPAQAPQPYQQPAQPPQPYQTPAQPPQPYQTPAQPPQPYQAPASALPPQRQSSTPLAPAQSRALLDRCNTFLSASLERETLSRAPMPLPGASSQPPSSGLLNYSHPYHQPPAAAPAAAPLPVRELPSPAPPVQPPQHFQPAPPPSRGTPPPPPVSRATPPPPSVPTRESAATPTAQSASSGPPNIYKEEIHEPSFQNKLTDFRVDKFGPPPPRAFRTQSQDDHVRRLKEEKARQEQIKIDSMERARQSLGRTTRVNVASTQATNSRTGSPMSPSSSASTKFQLPDVSKFQPPPPTNRQTSPPVAAPAAAGVFNRSSFPPTAQSTPPPASPTVSLQSLAAGKKKKAPPPKPKKNPSLQSSQATGGHIRELQARLGNLNMNQ